VTRRPAWAAARLAVSMFSIVPVPSPAGPSAGDAPLDAGLASRAVRWLPVVGLLLAAPAVALMLVVGGSGTDGGVLRRLLGAVLAIALLGVLTGGLHLDGLADTADGLASRRPRDQALEIMRRGDTGPLGVAALVFAVLLQVTALAALAAAGERQAVAGLLLGAATARTAVVVATGPAFPAARPGGFGALVAGRTSPRACLLAAFALLVSAAAAGLVLGGTGLAVRLPAAATAGLLTGLAVAGGARSRLGGLTGDVFGAIVEISMAATLVALVVAT
jgi:adenosylcobinamide-GDP ribazoletransferase